MKIIFLDIDGVMKSGASAIRNYGEMGFGLTLHPEHVEALNFILDNTDARIVISSTYRLGYSVKEMKQLFKDNGIDYKYVISHTPFLDAPKGEYVERGDEIAHWLQYYPQIAFDKFGVDLDVESFVVLDDDNDMNAINPINFVQTNRNYGLTHYDAVKAIEVLNGEPLIPTEAIVRGMKW